MTTKHRLGVMLATCTLLAVAACGLSDDVSYELSTSLAAVADDKRPLKTEVELNVVSYNVHGLPESVSGEPTRERNLKMSPRLNAFELALVQEDFSYHAELTSQSTHEFQSTPMAPVNSIDLGDGLNVLSRFQFEKHSRTKWEKCNGTFGAKNDCLTSKGFQRFEVDFGNGLQVDVYNVHFDAGRTKSDASAREAQVTQLVKAIRRHSADRALLVVGDTNMKADDEATFLRLLREAGLRCACRVSNCSDTSRVDRILFRSSSDVNIDVRALRVDSSFVDEAGQPLSDHEPVIAALIVSN